MSSNAKDQGASPAPRADQQVDDKVNANNDALAASGGSAVDRMLLQEDTKKLLSFADRNDVSGFSSMVNGFNKDHRDKVKAELIREHRLDSLPMAMQVVLSDSPYHQESQIDPGGEISCTTAVRIEGVTADQALVALTKTNWKDWWATSSTSGPPPNFNFVPEAPLAAIPGFHLSVAMSGAAKEGKNWRLPARLDGTFTGPAEMYIESVDGGVVVHDTWMGMRLQNFAMEHLGGAAFWTNGHLQALRGAMAGGLLGPTGFAGLRKYLLNEKK